MKNFIAIVRATREPDIRKCDHRDQVIGWINAYQAVRCGKVLRSSWHYGRPPLSSKLLTIALH